MIDVVFLSHNRLAFTTESFRWLLKNTDWDLVDRLVVYDDASTDGTLDHLVDAIRATPVPVEIHSAAHGSPVAAMLDHLSRPGAPLFAKVDNDVCVPPGWLATMLDVLDRHFKVELLGMEAGMSGVAGRDGALFDGVYGVTPATNIGGIGVFRRSAFESRKPMRADGRYGFSEWQHTYRPGRAWITPDLPVCLLDRLPFEPWLSLSAEYVRRDWQRDWPCYDPQWMRWAWEWMAPEEAVA